MRFFYDPHPLDLLEELHLLRALTIDFIERYDMALEDNRPCQGLDIADASRLIERIARVVDTIHKTRQEHTISLDTFKRLMEQMALAVARYVRDAEMLRAIETAWRQIRVEPPRPPLGGELGARNVATPRLAASRTHDRPRPLALGTPPLPLRA